MYSFWRVVERSVAALYAVCIIVMNGLSVVAKNPLFTGIFTAVLMLALLIVGFAWGMGWLKSQYPTFFGWMGWLFRK